MTFKDGFEVFNRPDRVVEGWYWALPAHALKRGTVKPVNLMGRELAIYRGEDGVAVAMDAYCPHMGAHLAQGRVEGNALRCLFHDWKYSADGTCVEVPCLERPPHVKVRTWPTAEKYGLIWVWTGDVARQPLPWIPELKEDACDARLGNRFEKECHPNVVMINAIDAQHFNSVHNLPVNLFLEPTEVNTNAITFSNTTRVPDTSMLTRFIGRFYKGPLTYSMTYWYGSTGSVTIGPDFLHFHIIFALRQLAGGRTEGQTLLVTKARPGVLGWMFNRVLLVLTEVVGNYFAKGDTLIFKSIRFNLQTPIPQDQAIVRFIKHADAQQTYPWRPEPTGVTPPPPDQREPHAALRVM